MNWKSTIVLAVLAAGAFGAWVILKPAEETGVARPRPFEWRESVFQSIKIRIPDQPEIVLERRPAPVQGSLWHLEKPAKPVDDTRVAEMIAALRRLSLERSIKPGAPDYTPSAYGLDKGVVSVQVDAAGETRTVKFGNASMRQPDSRFFMIEGEEEIFFGPVDTASPFQRPVAELRSGKFVHLDPARVVGVEISRRFQRAGADGKPGLKTEYEKLKYGFKDREDAKGKTWFLVGLDGRAKNEPARDIGYVITGLRDLKAEEYVPLADPAAFGFGEPELIVRFDVLQPPSNDTEPMVVEIGDTVDKGARKMTYVRVDGGDEAALVNASTVERIPRERRSFIPPHVINFDVSIIESIEMVTDTGHKVSMTKKEIPHERGQEKWNEITWSVVEPQGLPVEPASVNDFINWLLSVTVTDILGEQPDLAAFGLDKPDVVLSFNVRPKGGEIERRVFKVGRPGESTEGHGYLLKPGSDDVFQIEEKDWRRFDRTDLNFRKLDLFNTAIDAIVGVSFMYQRDHLSANPVRFAVRKGEGGKWEFEDAALRNQGAKVDPDLMVHILGHLNYIRAEGFLTRNPRITKDYDLEGDDPMGRLVIRYADPSNPGKAAEKVFRFSRSFLDPTQRVRLYYAKIEPAPGDTSPSSDATIVFRAKSDLVESLRRGVLLEPKPEPDSSQDREKED